MENIVISTDNLDIKLDDIITKNILTFKDIDFQENYNKSVNIINLINQTNINTINITGNIHKISFHNETNIKIKYLKKILKLIIQNKKITNINIHNLTYSISKCVWETPYDNEYEPKTYYYKDTYIQKQLFKYIKVKVYNRFIEDLRNGINDTTKLNLQIYDKIFTI